MFYCDLKNVCALKNSMSVAFWATTEVCVGGEGLRTAPFSLAWSTVAASWMIWGAGGARRV